MRRTKEQKAITLIALIITIVVLLILAVVAINSITNDGIIGKAQDAANKYNESVQNEADQLQNYLNYLNEHIGGNPTGGETSKITGPLLTATNVENYGKKVVGFQSKGEGLDTLIWRVFYQDEKNVYLISETADGNYPVSALSLYESATTTKKEIIEKYNNGADVSTQGQDLMPSINKSSIFAESNTSSTIIATAYMSDIDVWDEYTDAAGKAAWAMGGPTIELFVKSYNASNLGNTIEISDSFAGGYNNSSDGNSGWITNQQKNGIYTLNQSNFWTLNSPGVASGDVHSMCTVISSAGLISNAVNNVEYTLLNLRPIVCIPLSDFDYTLE